MGGHSAVNAALDGGEPRRLEHNDLRWITPSQIPGYEFCPADVEILAQIAAEGLNKA